MNRQRVILFALLALLALAPVAYFRWLMQGEGELALKPLWVDLQRLEWQWRGDPRRGPLLVRRYGRHRHAVLGIAGTCRSAESPRCQSIGRPRSWIVLNEHAPSRTLRQLGTFDGYDLPCPAIERVKAAVPDIDDYVIAWLRSICRPSGG